MSYKLTYFNFAGRAEPIRWILAVAGVKYVDNRIKWDTWATLKSTTPWGQLPVLEVNGEQLGQTTTICRFLARKFKLTGKDEWEAAKCDEYVDAANDLFTEWLKFFLEKDENKKEELKRELVKTHCNKFFTKMNTIQAENGGLYLVSKEMTWADILIAQYIMKLEITVDSGILSGFPHLTKMKDTVESHPSIKEWLQIRPKDNQ